MKKAALMTGIVVFVALVAFPFFWQFLTSLKSPAEVWSAPPVWLPTEGFEPAPIEWGEGAVVAPRFVENYTAIFAHHPFGRYLVNSAIVATVTTLVCLLFGCMAGYALAKLNFPGKTAILSLTLTVSMFPQVAIAPTLFLVLKQFDLIDRYAGLVLPYTTFAMPLALWNLTTFFRQIPDELKESAIVDGATPWKTFWQIFLPLATPGIFTTGILTFIAAWNEFLFALYFTNSEAMRTVPVGIALFPGQYEAPWGQIAAASVVVTLPLIVLVLLAQKRLVSGLTAGAVKG